MGRQWKEHFREPIFRKINGGFAVRFAKQMWHIQERGAEWVVIHWARNTRLPYICFFVFDTLEEARAEVMTEVRMVFADYELFADALPEWIDYENPQERLPEWFLDVHDWRAFLAKRGPRVPVRPLCKPFSTLPVTTMFGELRGWRSWRLAFTPVGPRLQSSYKATVWESGTMMAKDGAGNSADVFDCLATVAAPAHGAGYYAYKTAQDLAVESHDEDVRVGGEVELWGDIVEHEKGYRAECIRIVSLIAIGPRAALVLDDLRAFYLGGN